MYGVVGYKTHAKLIMVVRREGGPPAPLLPPRHRQLPPADGARRTRTTACSPATTPIGEDVHELFLQLTSPTRAAQLQRILQSPFTLHEAMLEQIAARDRAMPRAGRPARIIAKLNALIEPQIIRALYEASMRGRAAST